MCIHVWTSPKTTDFSLCSKFHPFCNVFLSFSSVFLKENKIVTCLEWLWIVKHVPNNNVCLRIISPYHSKETSYIQPKWMALKIRHKRKKKICCINLRCWRESRQDSFSTAASQKTAFLNTTILILKLCFINGLLHLLNTPKSIDNGKIPQIVN